LTPRVITKAEAAAYCGCTLRTFDSWVEKGIVPGAIPNTHRWDRKGIDLALDMVSHLPSNITPSDHLTPYQRWKADNGPRAPQA
jgi:hypothetical protein